MKKQTKLEYVSPTIVEMELLLADFIADANASDLKNFNRVEGTLDLTDYDDNWN